MKKYLLGYLPPIALVVLGVITVPLDNTARAAAADSPPTALVVGGQGERCEGARLRFSTADDDSGCGIERD